MEGIHNLKFHRTVQVLTTPIQLANFAAIIANKGWYIPPHFIKNIENDSIDKNYKNIKKSLLISEKYFDQLLRDD